MTTQTKADDNGPFKEFTFESWLREGVEGCQAKMKRDFKTVNLADVQRHLRNAQKEQLLAVRSVIDKAIERLEEKEKPPQA